MSETKLQLLPATVMAMMMTKKIAKKKTQRQIPRNLMMMMMMMMMVMMKMSHQMPSILTTKEESTSLGLMDVKRNPKMARNKAAWKGSLRTGNPTWSVQSRQD